MEPSLEAYRPLCSISGIWEDDFWSVSVGHAMLQVLDVSANGIERVPSLGEALPSLVELIVDENALRTLGDELVGLSKLKKLSARFNRIAAQDPVTGLQVR